MEGLNELVSSGRSGLEKLIKSIPGIKGYENKEDRRDTDKIVRETIAQRFSEQWDRISGIERDLAKGAGIIYLSDLESAALKIRQFADRIRTASYGYAGLFDAVKVDDTALQQIYDYDLYLFNLSETVAKSIDAVESAVAANDGIQTAIADLNKIAGECIVALNRRSEVYIGTQNA
jgi:hypothetical protein